MKSSHASSGSSVTVPTRPPSPEVGAPSTPAKSGLIVFTLAGGLSIFLFGSPFFNTYPTNDSVPYGVTLVSLFGVVSLVLGRRSSLVVFSSCAYGLFVAAAANLVLTIGPFNWLITSSEAYQEIAQDKLAQFLAIVPVVLVLTWARRRPWDSIYLQKGRPRRWIGFGLPWLVIGTLGMIAIAYAYDIDAETLLAIAPWIFAFVALNATMEELWFRAIFLRPYTAAMGGRWAVFVTALVFGITHVNAEYMSASEIWVFGAIVFIIGLVTAWVMRWANSLWGAVLFHMGMDLLIIVQIIESA